MNSTAPNPITQHVPSHCSPRTQFKFSVFYFFPQPISHQHPIPLFNTFLLTAVQGPNPNSLFLFFPRPVSQQQPIPLLNTLLLTAVRGPTPKSVFLFLSPTQKVNSTQSHYSTSSLSLPAASSSQQEPAGASSSRQPAARSSQRPAASSQQTAASSSQQ